MTIEASNSDVPKVALGTKILNRRKRQYFKPTIDGRWFAESIMEKEDTNVLSLKDLK